MPCAFTLYFDLETDAAVRRLWQGIEDAGLPSFMLTGGYRPHLTLAVCNNLDLAAVRADLARLVAGAAPVPVMFHALGVFLTNEGVVYLGATTTHALRQFHAQFWELAEASMVGAVDYYRPDVWVPHVTLAYGLQPDQIGPAIHALREAPIPSTGTVNELVVTDITPEGYSDYFAARLGAPLVG